MQLVRSRFAGFSKIDPFHSLKVGSMRAMMRPPIAWPSCRQAAAAGCGGCRGRSRKSERF